MKRAQQIGIRGKIILHLHYENFDCRNTRQSGFG